MQVIVAMVVAALTFLAEVPTQSAVNDHAAILATQVCAACHGRDGNSISPMFPRLAGQLPQYTEAQLQAFRNRTRADPPAVAYMWGMASQLDNGTIKDLAAYYASQAARPIRTNRAAGLGLGKQIYERGIPEQGLQACNNCHGAFARGSAAAPRLAGQHPEYLVKQLGYFKTKLRGNDPVMVAVCAELTAEQMQAVALFASRGE